MSQQLRIPFAGTSYVHRTMTDGVVTPSKLIRQGGLPAPRRLGYQCKTCWREYRSYTDFLTQHGECDCPSLVTYNR